MVVIVDGSAATRYQGSGVIAVAGLRLAAGIIHGAIICCTIDTHGREGVVVGTDDVSARILSV